MNVEQIEQRISRKPTSPLFARLAGEYLSQGRIDDARSLCLIGLASYPEYSTLHLILSKCCIAQDNHDEAKEYIQRALTSVPNSTVLQKLYSIIQNGTAASYTDIQENSHTELLTPEDQTISETESIDGISLSSADDSEISHAVITDEPTIEQPALDSVARADLEMGVDWTDEDPHQLPAAESPDDIEAMLSDSSAESTEEVFTDQRPREYHPILNELTQDSADDEHAFDLLTNDLSPDIISDEQRDSTESIREDIAGMGHSADVSQGQQPEQLAAIEPDISSDNDSSQITSTDADFTEEIVSTELLTNDEPGEHTKIENENFTATDEVIQPPIEQIENPNTQDVHSPDREETSPDTARSEVTPPKATETTASFIPDSGDERRIASKTLAEIYASQGEYAEAIQTYQLLKRIRPGISKEIELRIEELKRILQLKQEE